MTRPLGARSFQPTRLRIRLGRPRRSRSARSWSSHPWWGGTWC